MFVGARHASPLLRQGCVPCLACMQRMPPSRMLDGHARSLTPSDRRGRGRWGEKSAWASEPLGKEIMVDWAMRYGNPSLAARLAHLVAEGCERVLVIPLYPQYCAAPTATACDEVFRALARLRHQPALRI